MFLALLEWTCIGASVSDVVILVVNYDVTLTTQESIVNAAKESPMNFVVVVFCLVVAAFVTHLFFYHLVIICKSQSTYENKKKHFKGALFNPYKQTFCEELGEILCSRRPKKFYSFRDFEPEKPVDSLRTLSYKMVKHDNLISRQSI